MRFLSFLVPCLLFTATTGAQTLKPPVQVDVDDAVFAYDDQYSLLEVYLSFEARGLPFAERAGTFLAELPVEIDIARRSDATLEGTPTEPVWSDDSAIAFAVEDTAMLDRGQYFVHQYRTLVPPGEYQLRIVIPADPDLDRHELAVTRDVVVEDFATGRASLSDVTIAAEVVPSDDRGSPFYKNGFSVRPNPNRLFGRGLTTLYYYAEAYNLLKERVGGEEYTLYAYVAEANRAQPVGGLQHRTRRPLRSPDVIAGSFDLTSVPSGSYFLRLALLNEDNEALDEQVQKIFVYNPDVQREQTVFLEETFEMSQYAAMPEEEVDQRLAYARVVANEQERRRIRSLESLDDRRRFLLDFWKKRDPIPSTPQNEFEQEIMSRIEYADERYSTMYSEGWQTDRGRVLVRYGYPVAIEPRLYERDMIPHEIWQYDNIPGEGQAVFVFADRRSFGQFELIHATVPGERSLPEWQLELRRR